MPDKPSLILLIPSLAGGGAQRVAINLIPYLNSHFNLTLAVLEDQISYQVPKKINKVAFSPRLMSNFSHIIRIPFHIYSLFRLIRTTKSNIVLSILEQANIINILTKIFAGHTTIISQHSEPIRQYKNKGLLGKIIFITTKLLYPQASQRIRRIISMFNLVQSKIILQFSEGLSI
ncbi:MAG: glycosyltransferase family 4 protein [Ignavibacteriae bacterium]|nr:glycosyltransferase family 4 protein [Ignavibacteriota bacterium]